MDNKFCKLSGLFSDFSYASRGVLTHLHIDVFKAVKDLGENFSFNDNFGMVNGVFSDLCKALANVPLKLSVRVGDQGSQVGHGTLVNNSLREFFSVFCDFRESGRGDTL